MCVRGDENQFLKQNVRAWLMTDCIAVADSGKKKITYPQRYTSKLCHISCLFINQ